MGPIPGYADFDELCAAPTCRYVRARRLADHAAVLIKVPLPTATPQVQRNRLRHEHALLQLLSGSGVALEPIDLILRDVSAAGMGDDGDIGAALVCTNFAGVRLDAVLKVQRLPFLPFLEIALSMADAVAVLHMRRVTHKDLSPATILLDPDTRAVRIIDFGVATRLLHDMPEPVEPRLLDGNLLYMSPEQTGRVTRPVDWRTDIYALGATFYEMLTGAPPFHSNDPLELIHSHLVKAVPPPTMPSTEIPADLAAVVLKCLAKSPDDRYQSAHGLRHDLHACRNALLRDGRIAGLKLGEADIPSHLGVVGRVYGRDDDTRELTKVFNRAGTTPGIALVVLTGAAGIGKSTLVQRGLRPLVARTACFASARFARYAPDLPYHGLSQLGRELVQMIMALGTDERARWASTLQQALEANAPVLIDLVPTLADVIGPQPAPPTLGPLATRHRLHVSMRQFFGCFSRPGQPLVLVIDDAEWLDSASVPLIAALGVACSHLMIVAVVSDGSSPEQVPLIDTLARTGCGPSVMRVPRLPMASVHAYVAERLKCSAVTAAPLARLLEEASAGNPLHLQILMDALGNDDLLRFDSQAGAWRWQPSQVAGLTAPHALATLLAARLGALPASCREAMQMAACLGEEFDLRWLSAARNRTIPETADDLWPALDAGYVRPMGDAQRTLRDHGTEPPAERPIMYRFAHDSLAQAAMGLFGRSERSTAHRALRTTLAQRLNGAPAAPDAIFVLAHHTNQSVQQAVGLDATQQTARIGVLRAAGDRALAVAAFDAAILYYAAARAALPPDAWRSEPTAALAMTQGLIECYVALGNRDLAKSLVDEATAHTHSHAARADLSYPQIAMDARLGLNQEVADAARAMLRRLGIGVPRRPSRLRVGIAFARASLVLWRQRQHGVTSPAQLTDLPAPAASDQHMAPRLLMHLAVAAYQRGDARLCVLSALLGMTYGLRFANRELTALGCLGYGLVLMTVFGRYGGAAAFGRAGGRREVPRIRASAGLQAASILLFHHWAAPARDAVPRLLDARSTGLTTGDATWTGYAALLAVLTKQHVGDPLHDVLREADQLMPLHDAREHGMLEIYVRHVRALTADVVPSHASPPEPSLQDAPGRVFLTCLAHLVRLQDAYLFGHFAAAVAAGDGADMRACKGMLAYCDFAYYHALAAAAYLAGGAQGAQARQARRTLRRHGRDLARWARTYAPNFAHKHALVVAERAALRGDFGAAMRGYDQAITGAKGQGYVQDAAIANACAARFLLIAGKPKLAKPYLIEARHQYRKWGATALAARLAEIYAELLFREVGPRDTETAARSATVVVADGTGDKDDATDLAAVLRACQRVSGEIVLRDLLMNLTRIALEISRSHRVLFYLPEGDAWRLAAFADAVENQFAVLYDGGANAPQPDMEAPQALIQHVGKTMESVLMSNTQHTKTKSVLCLSAVFEGKTAGVLYLENRSKHNAFGSGRVEGLRLLLSQAAVALHNAHAYAALEARVLRAASEVRAAQARLVEVARASVDKQLAGNFAHEICNALASSKMFLDGAVDSVGEPSANLCNETADALFALYTNVKDLLEPAQRTSLALDMRRITDTELRLHEMLQLVARANGRALAITQQIVEFARLGEQVHGMARVNLSQLLGQLVEEARLEFSDSSIRIDTDVVEGMEVIGTEAHCYSVVRNLLQNARDALRDVEGRPRCITVKSRLNDFNVRVEIIDNGPGIPADIRDKIFDAFFSTKPQTGTGLGLSMVKKILTLYGGNIDVTSQPGQETAFTITLPRAV